MFSQLTGMFCSETYQYYNLPFCTPKDKEYKTEGLGEVLEGDRLVNTPYDIKFRVDKENEILCSRELTAKDLRKFRKAVKKDYYFQVWTASAHMMQQNFESFESSDV